MKKKKHWISPLVNITNLGIPLNSFERTNAMRTLTEAKYTVSLEMTSHCEIFTGQLRLWGDP